ncbi:hypothetical protein BGZ46_010735 [Entomortierella lignicola]|nr:hypothetical protein BGZ46_010735 [Entomortierella lignicola]
MSALPSTMEMSDTKSLGHLHADSMVQPISSLGQPSSGQATPKKREQQVQKLTVVPFEANDYVASASSSVSSSPTSSTFSGSSDPTQQKVSFRFSSPLFYDQKLHIYQLLSTLYQRLGRYIDQYPHVLMALQYSIATIHGATLYLISVILSIAQLVMITFTVESLDWIQTHQPLMREWNSRFPGFVFPALDIESGDEDDTYDPSLDHKDRRYWASKKKLKDGNDPSHDNAPSEKFTRRQSIKQSMNSTIRSRLAKYQQWIPCSWAAEETVPYGDSEDSEASGPNSHSLGNKRVTFNEQVLVFSRRRSSQAAQPPPYGMAMPAYASENNSHATEEFQTAHSVTDLGSDEDTFMSNTMISKPTPSATNMNALEQEEAEYQDSMASSDVNGSGSSSPVISQPDIQRNSVSPSESFTSETFQDTTIAQHEVTPIPAQAPSIPMQTNHDIHKKPSKIGSLLHHLHHGHGEEKKSVSRSTSRSESEESTRPVVTSTQPPPSQNPNTESAVVSLTTMTPLQEYVQEGVTRSSSLSPLTRGNRSSSLGLPKHNHSGEDSSDGGEGDKHKNLIYRIVHPQRYKRELEQQESEKEYQRLLTLVQLQHKLILGEEGSTPSEATASSLADPASALCGNAHYYATSAEFVEGLGAPDSVISTSVGTSFPEELQAKKSKSRSKQPAPLIIAAAAATATGSSEANPAETTEHHTQKSPLKSLFKRNSRKMEADSGSKLHSPSHLHQFFHPGHKHTQSTSSLIRPATICTETTLSKYEHDAPNPRHSHHARSSSRDFTTFTALGVPVVPPVQTKAVPTSAVCPFSAVLPSEDPAMEHTTFAAFSFPSPVPSPITSSAPSPRNSMNMSQVDHGSDVTGQEEETYAQYRQRAMREIPLEDKNSILNAAEPNPDGNENINNSNESTTKPRRSFSLIKKLSHKKKKN